MAQRSTRTRTSRAFPKTLTGLLASIALAVLAALGVKTDWFHGKPSAPKTERPPTVTTTPAPGALPHTPGSFEAAKRTLYEQVYPDHGCFCPTPRKGKISQTTLIFSAVALPQPP